ncbi:MAG: YggS family pyridoxal phosphate-dependent enzyme [Anaerolineaceae bacterium]|nr:YggS family pyridoxal phosphate-dependent enzyme [Anaerolineaceae bacterium]
MINEDLVSKIQKNLAKVRKNIEDSAYRSGRKSVEIKLLTVTKRKSIKEIEAALKCGLKVFGENYPEESVPKILHFKESKDIEWHMIGHIQSRKALIVTKYFQHVQAIDSLKIAAILNQKLADIHKSINVLIEVNISGEESKHGFKAVSPEEWDKLLVEFEKFQHLPNLKIRGLMTMPPLFMDPESVRPYFKKLKLLQSFLQINLNRFDWTELSMGTSADYEVAIEEGATVIRLGEAILGPRGGQL